MRRGLLKRLRGRAFLAAYSFSSRARGKAFSLLAGGGFHSFGARSVLQPPVRLSGESRISIGSGVYIGAGSWLQVLAKDDQLRITIGDGTSIVGGCTLSAAESIVIGKSVLMARNVYIADHMHSFDDSGKAILDQGVTRVEAVEIGDGAWLGQNVVVGPGVRIGRGAVVGANSVVLDDVPDRCVAVGAPARVARRLDAETAAPVGGVDSAV
jgi:acetyltransferase-like isoleucine patch superfamily enzyme